MTNGGTLNVNLGDDITLSWTGGHNVYRTEGPCSMFSTLQDFTQSSSYSVIESSHPGGKESTLGSTVQGVVLQHSEEAPKYTCNTNEDGLNPDRVTL